MLRDFENSVYDKFILVLANRCAILEYMTKRVEACDFLVHLNPLRDNIHAVKRPGYPLGLELSLQFYQRTDISM